jgi:hypothetical protein
MNPIKNFYSYDIPIYQRNIKIESELKGLHRKNSKCNKCKYNKKYDKTSYEITYNKRVNRCICNLQRK